MFSIMIYMKAVKRLSCPAMPDDLVTSILKPEPFSREQELKNG
jgi:hypothetical protein